MQNPEVLGGPRGVEEYLSDVMPEELGKVLHSTGRHAMRRIESVSTLMEARHYQDSPGDGVDIPPNDIGSTQVLVDATAHVVANSPRRALKETLGPGHGSQKCGRSLLTRQNLSKESNPTRSDENDIALDVLTMPHGPQSRCKPLAMSS